MEQPLRYLGIIPARFASSRFPGKPLAEIHGKPMVRHVYEQASKALETVYVATDDERIFNAVKDFGGKVVMTSSLHKSGTDRCAEAADLAEKEQSLSYDVVLNVQGDEPFIEPAQLELLKSCFSDRNTQIATLLKKVTSTDELFDPNRPKVVVSGRQEALYFSRSTIPYLRNAERDSWLSAHEFFIHIGLYGFRRDVLPEITSLPQSPLELAESLEQLRWIENGYRIAVRLTTYESFGVDTPDDLKKLLASGL
ncbi:MAG: 3-deoxy-manno-octulosonate cytidylyltransferase [Bacteroidales bacterium]|nr:3-deoxy-manno-octulosonate cytidylyltransferase [Bacteroidales bacterium]